MCGIWAVFGVEDETLCSLCIAASSKIRHRGPDAWRMEYNDRVKKCCLSFYRLTIVDSLYGMQPMKLHKYPHVVLICNGEIYNFKRLGQELHLPYETLCDVECIIHLYSLFGIEKTVRMLDGVFAFCLIDMTKKKVFLARDPYGVRPLFTVQNDSGMLGICSEAKGLMAVGQKTGSKWHLEQFRSGRYQEFDLRADGSVSPREIQKYFSPGDRPLFTPAVPYELVNGKEGVAKLLEEACRKRLMADRRIGCLLSGGLDSSLVAALITKLAKKENYPYKIQTFAIGMGDSPDIVAARQVADYIGSEHHEIIFTENDVRTHLDSVIYYLESFDITTVRASIGMYLLSKYIKENTDTTVIFSGEGADEVAQGYIYFRDAPNPSAAHEESVRLLSDIYLYDGLRADRTTSAFSLELRVPFLDIQFTEHYLSFPRESRQPKDGVEKFLLRSAFEGSGLLPDEILWRHKEAFSDGVASVRKSLFTIIQEIVDERLSDEAGKTSKAREAQYYKEIFDKSYPQQRHFTPYYWMPKWTDVDDPSARFIKHYGADKTPSPTIIN